MSRKKLHTKLLAALLLVLVSGKFTACEPEDWMLSIDCGDCYGYAPDSADLIIKLTINAENDSVPLTFYLGDYEEGVIDWQDTATSEEFYLYSKINSSYTVRATYRSGDKLIEAFDADDMELYNANEECGSPCYIIKGGIFDVSLLE
jgi:hypothetical protein